MSSSEEAAKGWSAAARVYAKSIEKTTTDGANALLDLVETIKPLSADSVVFDSGAGSGALTALVHARSGGKATITATDVAPGMLALLAERNLPGVTTQVLDATRDHVEQGLPEGHFTHAVSSFMVQFLGSAKAVQFAVDEMVRTVRPHGEGVVGLAIWGAVQFIDAWNLACTNLDPDFQFDSTAVFGDAWATVEELEAGFTQAGLVDIRTKRFECWLEFESAEQFVHTFYTMNNPGWIALQKMWTKGDPEEVREEFTRVVKEQYKDGKFQMWTALAVGKTT